jgi:UDP:flavonoid glycosyltransferase YjiC (YdhE family)
LAACEQAVVAQASACEEVMGAGRKVGKRILLTTWGSFGDLHPFLALALELKRRGHKPRIATCGLYREKVEGEGIEFAKLGPDIAAVLSRPEQVRRLFHPTRGSVYVLRGLVLPALREQWEGVRQCAADSELIVTHSVTFASHLFAERKRVPWISVALQPSMFLSRYDMPRLPQLELLRRAPGWAKQVGYRAGMAWTRRWFGEYDRLRAEIGLPPTARNPFFEMQFSPRGTLALFSPLFASPQADWPPNVTVTGFPFFDREDAARSSLSPGMETFLASGAPPLVFTSGSSAVIEPDNFFEVSLRAARALGHRAVLLAGAKHENRLALPDGKDFAISAYEPHSKLFPRAAAIVHQGGIGTTGQALRSGVPQLVAAVSHDQPDNGDRVRRIGAGDWMPREQYQFARAREAIARILGDGSMRAAAQSVREAVGKETGATTACDVIESQFRV